MLPFPLLSKDRLFGLSPTVVSVVVWTFAYLLLADRMSSFSTIVAVCVTFPFVSVSKLSGSGIYIGILGMSPMLAQKTLTWLLLLGFVFHFYVKPKQLGRLKYFNFLHFHHVKFVPLGSHRWDIKCEIPRKVVANLFSWTPVC